MFTILRPNAIFNSPAAAAAAAAIVNRSSSHSQTGAFLGNKHKITPKSFTE
jgi:hypothetical protein